MTDCNINSKIQAILLIKMQERNLNHKDLAKILGVSYNLARKILCSHKVMSLESFFKVCNKMFEMEDIMGLFLSESEGLQKINNPNA